MVSAWTSRLYCGRETAGDPITPPRYHHGLSPPTTDAKAVVKCVWSWVAQQGGHHPNSLPVRPVVIRFGVFSVFWGGAWLQ